MHIGGLPVEGSAVIAVGFFVAVLVVSLVLTAWVIAQSMKKGGQR